MINGMTCIPCDLHAKGETERAWSFETARAHRITLALLTGTGDRNEAVAIIGEELQDCQPCSLRLGVLGVGMEAAALVALHGEEKAIEMAQRLILEALDNSD
jgi:hypothetical protein